MSVDPTRDAGLDQLLQEITRTLGENRRFLQVLKDDRADEPETESPDTAADETFEEL